MKDLPKHQHDLRDHVFRGTEKLAMNDRYQRVKGLRYIIPCLCITDAVRPGKSRVVRRASCVGQLKHFFSSEMQQ